MGDGNRIKYDRISGKSYNVTEADAQIDAFIAANSGDDNKVLKVQSLKPGQKRRRARKPIAEVSKTGDIKIRIPVFTGAKRFKDNGLISLEERKANKLREERELRRQALRDSRPT